MCNDYNLKGLKSTQFEDMDTKPFYWNTESMTRYC